MRLPEPRHLSIVVLSITTIAARLLVGPHITDDAYITMRYSRNLSLSGSMSYNPPDAVLGTSTPLWMLALASGQQAGIEPESLAVIVATVADVASVVLILSAPVGGSLAAVVAAATVAAWPAYVTYAVSGMETSLYVAMIVWCMSALSRGRTLMAAVAASLAALCRPDGALLVVVGFAWTWIRSSKTDAARFLGLAALLCAPWAVYSIAHFGSLVPASVIAKAAATDPWTLSVQNVRAYFFQGIYIPLTLLAMLGLGVLARAKRESAPFFAAWSVWGVSYLLAMTAANGFTHFPWYFMPLLPIYTAAAALGLEAIVARFVASPSVLQRPVVHTAIAVLFAAVLLGRMAPLRSYLDAAAAGREKLYASIASELAASDPQCTVAATEIGTIGYHYPGRVLDLVGLVSPEVLGRPVSDVLSKSDARWVVTYDTHFDRAIARSDTFAHAFARRSSIRVSDTRNLEVYERRERTDCGRE